jgi:hypothetical protein
MEEGRKNVPKLHAEGLHDLYCSPNIVRAIKHTAMRSAGHVARLEKRRDAFRVFGGRV